MSTAFETRPNFEYLYAKHKTILPYCIIQNNIFDETAFQKRLDSFLSESSYSDSKKNDVRNRLLEEYFTKKKDYENLIIQAQKKWFIYYDANNSSGINASIIKIFSDIQNKLINDTENIAGLIDGNQFRTELIEKNRQIEELKKNLSQFSSEVLDSFMQFRKSYLPSTAVTGTCIPFKFDQVNNIITTYLICNSSYCKNSNRFMFPGGHAFINEDSPEAIAIIKARTEAGLNVKPVDLYFSFKNQPDDFSPQFTIYRPPHFSYLFIENGNAKCYKEKNHLRHYDAVYVCEILEIYPDTECSQARIQVKLPNEPITLIQVKKLISDSINQYNIQNQLDGTNAEYFDDHIAKVLFDAHTDYVAYLVRNKYRK